MDKKRVTGIVDRFKLTDIWKNGGVEKPIEYAMLTNEIYKGCPGMKASEYKKLKGLRKESLRDNMTVAKRGGQVANDARKSYEKQTKKSAISKENALNYKYIDDKKLIDNKKSKKKK